MKKLFIFLTTLVLLHNCTGCDEDKRIDVSVLPEETNTGANTFGCVVDGWVYVGGRYFSNKHSILFICDSMYSEMNVIVQVEHNSNIKFIINNPEEGKECILTDVYFNHTKLPDGTANITLFDKERNIVSGRFECGERIKHGRFDVVYYYKR
ncbi:MAG: hypothetical protein LBQ28_03455 [Prevotellaceae bacterium]|jgi:hypothetical protein|nr:hypothetical protein [Prevotellaceae bacterium]